MARKTGAGAHGGGLEEHPDCGGPGMPVLAMPVKRAVTEASTHLPAERA